MSIRRKISIFIFIVAIFTTLSVGTQTFAKNVKYHKSLGRYLFLYKNKYLPKLLWYLTFFAKVCVPTDKVVKIATIKIKILIFLLILIFILHKVQESNHYEP